jgi:phosphohistidine phosphatase SixA
MRNAAIVDNAITFLTPFDIEFERRAGRLVYIPVRELAQETQTLMLVGHQRGTSAIASVLAEMLKTMMREASA